MGKTGCPQRLREKLSERLDGIGTGTRNSMKSEHRKSARPQLRFTTKEKAVDDPQLERGLELVARLLLHRWETRHTREVPDAEEDS